MTEEVSSGRRDQLNRHVLDRMIRAPHGRQKNKKEEKEKKKKEEEGEEKKKREETAAERSATC